MFSPYHMADIWLSGQSEMDSRPPSATSLHPWHHQPPPRPPPPRVYASTSNLPDCLPVIDPLHIRHAGHLRPHNPQVIVDAFSSPSRHPIPPMRSRASTLDRTCSDQRLTRYTGPSDRSTSYSQLTGVHSSVQRHDRATTVDRSLYAEKKHASSRANVSTGSTLNLKVWRQDEEGNFLKHYPNHHRRNSMMTLDENERKKRYAEIQREVQEKYFSKSSSVDCLQTTTTVARASLMQEYSPFAHHSHGASSSASYSHMQRGPSSSPLKSVTAKILSTFDLRSKRGPSKEHLYHTMITQQNQLQHLTSQQQYLQAQILWQQRQLREAELELIDHRSSRSRSRGSKDETSDREIEKARKVSTRMEIQESLHKQQTQVAQHILNLQAQLNLLMQRTSAQQMQQQPTVTSLVAANNTHTHLEPIQFAPHPETRNLASLQASDSPSSPSSQPHQMKDNHQQLHPRNQVTASNIDNERFSLNDTFSNDTSEMKQEETTSGDVKNSLTHANDAGSKVRRRNPPLTTPELSLQEVESAELRFDGEEDEAHASSPDASSRGQFLTPKFGNNSPPAESDIEDPDEVWLPDDDKAPAITSTLTAASPSLPPVPFSGRSGAFKPLSPMNSIIKQKSTDSRDGDYFDYTDLEEEDLDLPLPFDVEDTENQLAPNREDRRARIREQIKWEIEEEKRKEMEKDLQEEKYRKIKEREIENELSLKRLEREAAFLREMEEKEIELKVKQNELMRQAESEMLRQQQEFLHQQKLLLEQQEQLAKQRNELELQQQQLAQRKESLMNNTSFVDVQSTNLLPPKPQRAPRRASADEMAIDALSRNYHSNDDPRRMRSSLPHVERDTLSSPSLNQISSNDLRDTRHDNSPSQLSSESLRRVASNSLVPPEASVSNSIVRPLSPIPPPFAPISSSIDSHPSSSESASRNSPHPPSNINPVTNSPAIPVRTFAQLNSERSSEMKESITVREDNELFNTKVLAPSAVQLEKDSPQIHRQRHIASANTTAPISPQESLLDHFDQYSSRPTSALAISRRAGSRARSVSKEPESQNLNSSRATLSRQESGSVHGGSRTGLSTLDTPDSSASHPFASREAPLFTTVKTNVHQNHPLIDDMLLPHSSSGRRQTLPDVINALDIESSAPASTNTAAITPRTPVIQASAGGGGRRGPAKAKKTFEETVSARKMSVPSDAPVSPPEGWSREKVSEMAHAAREKRMASATENKSIPWRDWFLWLFHDRLVLIMLLFNGLLLYFFFNLLTQSANPSTPSTESTSILKKTSEKTLQLHQFLNSFFHHQPDARKDN